MKLLRSEAGAGDAAFWGMRKWVALTAGLLFAGCAHGRGDGVAIANAVIAAAWIATEIAVYEPPPPPHCAEDPGDPPHVCPGTTQPPPPPGD